MSLLSSKPFITVILHGHLDTAQLVSATADADAILILNDGASHDLVVDALAMTGYDQAARAAFIAWVKRHRPRLLRIAILTTNPLYHMVIGAMALASGVRMKPFKTIVDAEPWLGGAP